MTTMRVVEVSLDETLKQLRAELKREFPGTKFRVHRYRGSASGYVAVTWSDGPPQREVEAICAGYAGTRYSSADDIELPVQHLAADAQGEPVLVRYRTRSIRCSRELSSGWRAMYTRLVLELEEQPLSFVGPYTRETLLSLDDAALLSAAERTLMNGSWLSALAWRASEEQEVVR